ncbi:MULTISPECIES: MotA/TolQ/ExbB proton channel family protein [Bacteroidota]|jgi:biopolymer transport protein ExbB|uniref:MotA/TolQ/ExbB proton channel family protein n=1 Tax=Flectobacillus rivi TaxID=2984209 RepID=A0ABT6YX48_9BACT|nr:MULTISPECIES: MotA/TolQ/ExbB proton channel family protein [Bacteroidota]MDI9873451.1 MotA/TolQ/ExbB proton channel family protein [Flectobacillus rivi]NBB29606.1 MotA/TolQ/ExbB proton channel family protein [Cellulophaga sp. BC115SP]
MTTLLSILLQTTTFEPDTTSTTVTTVTKVGEDLNLFGLLEKGGWVMIPIFVLFFIALFLFVERYRYISKTSRLDNTFLFSIKEMLYAGNIQGAINYCKTSPFPIARLLEKGLNRIGSPMRDIENAIENSARVEIYNMEKNLGILSAIAKIAPMFGFLGTVSGMIRTFHNISVANKIDISTIASGIYEKMVTSATGLMVGIIAYFFYTILTTMIDRTVNKMEVTAIDFLDILHKPASK